MKKHCPLLYISLAVLTTLVAADSVGAQTDVNELAIERLENGMEVTTLRRADEGDGPHERLILRGATIIDGTGAPPMGPVDIVIEGDRITEVRSVGFPMAPINEQRRPQGATKELDFSGMYILPGLIDMHAHTGGGGKAPQPEYTYKLWMGNGITTSRGVGHGSMMWALGEKAASDRNDILSLIHI